MTDARNQDSLAPLWISKAVSEMERLGGPPAQGKGPLWDKLESGASNPALVISMTYLQDRFRSFFGKLRNFVTAPGFDRQSPIFALTGLDLV